MLQPILGSFIR